MWKLGIELRDKGRVIEAPTTKPTRSIDELLEDRDLLDAAFRRAFRNAVLEHRRAGVPMVFYKNGQIVHVPPDQVPLPEDAS